MWTFGHLCSSAKINISYSILFNLTTSYSSYFGGKKGISRNKTSFFLLMLSVGCVCKPDKGCCRYVWNTVCDAKRSLWKTLRLAGLRTSTQAGISGVLVSTATKGTKVN